MKGMLGLLGIIFVALTAMPASAATLYKCVGVDGIPNYVNKRLGGANCTVVSRYTPSRTSPAKPYAAPVAASEPPRGAAGGVPPATIISPPISASMPASPSGSTTAVPAVVAPVPAPTRRTVSGQVYSYMKDGVRHYSSTRPAGIASAQGVRTISYSFVETCYACAVNPGINFNTLRLNTVAYQAEIAAAAREFGVEEAIVRAIIHAESSYNPTALSRAGAQGLMQLMPATARRFGVTDSYDAGQNIRGGVQYLSWLLKRFNGNLTLAAAGYNAGEGAVDRHGGVPPYSETQRYVQRVGVLAERYRGVLAAR